MILPHEQRALRLEKILLLIIIAVFCAVVTVHAQDRTNEVEDYISWFHQNVNKKKLNKALQYAPLVYEVAAEFGEDPLLISTIISHESSWRTNAIGDLKEVGLMQVMPGNACGKGYDTSKATGQLRAGTNCLQASRARCGKDLNKVLTFYGTGKGCTSKSKRTQKKMNLRVAHYRAAVKRHRSK